MTDTATKARVQTAPETARESQLPRKRHRPWWHFAGALVFYMAIVLAGAEAFFNWCGVGQEEFLEPDPVFGCRHIPNKLVVWRMEGYSADTLSSIGAHDVEHAIAKPAGTYRIALLGDSATEGMQVSLADTYGRQLEHLLNAKGLNSKGLAKRFEVINFACSSYSTGQEVLQFERQVKAYQPDLTILLYNRGDNVENVRKPTKLDVEPRPYFYIDQLGKLAQDNHVLVAQANKLQPDKFADYLRRHSRLYGVLSHANLNLSISDGFYRKVRSLVLKPFQGRSARKISQSEAPYPEQESWPVTKLLLNRLAEDCQAAGSKLLIVIFPNLIGDMEFAQQGADLASQAATQASTANKQAPGFALVDLTGPFKSHPDPNSLFLKYHFSAAGHAFVADQLDKELLKQTLVNAPPDRQNRPL